jgi:type II secretory pathway component PulK
MQPTESRRGIALILALLVLTLLVVVVGQLAYTTRNDLQVARNAADEQGALFACWGGLEFGKALLRDDVQRNAHDGLADRWARLRKPVEIGGVPVEVRIEDEERKLNLLLLKSPNEAHVRWAEETLKRLVKLARQADQTEGALPPEQLADHLITWLKEGKVPGVSSDEQTFREEGGTDVIPPLTLAELLAVEGVTREVLYGPAAPPPRVADPADDPYALPTDPTEPPGSLDELLGKSPKTVRGLAPFLTLWTGGHVNVNTVDALLLKAMAETIGDDTVEAIVGARQPGGSGEAAEDADAFVDQAYTDVAKVREAPGMDDAGEGTPWKTMSPFLTVGSQVFKLTATATVRNVRKTVEQVVRREPEGFRVLWYAER